MSVKYYTKSIGTQFEFIGNYNSKIIKMTLVNLKHRSADGRFNNLIEDFYKGFPSVIKSDFGTDIFRQNPPVNIKRK